MGVTVTLGVSNSLPGTVIEEGGVGDSGVTDIHTNIPDPTWILATTDWRDAGIWIDTELWMD